MQNPVVRRWLMPVTAPLLLTVYPILYFYASNIHLLDTGDVLKTLAICLAATLIVLAVASIVLRNPNKASVPTSLIVILFYTYGHIHDLLNPSSHRYLLLPWALALVTGTILVVWKGDRLLPEGFVTAMATPTTASDGAYGQLQTWTNGPGGKRDADYGLPEETFWMQGHDGQTVALLPSHGLAVIRLGLTPSKLGYRPQPMVKRILDLLDASKLSAGQAPT